MASQKVGTDKSGAELKGPADPQKMTPEVFEVVCRTKHADIRSTCSPNIIAAFEQWVGSGRPQEDLLVVLAHESEALIPEEEVEKMRAQGIEVGCMPVDRLEFAEVVKEFVHPQHKTKVYEKLAVNLQRQTPSHFYVAVMGFGNCTLTRVKIEEVKEQQQRKEERMAARAAKLASEQALVPTTG